LELKRRDWRGSHAVRNDAVELIARLEQRLQAVSVENVDPSGARADETLTLQSGGRHGDTRPTHAKNGGQCFMRDRHVVAVKALVRHQQPPDATLNSRVGGIPGGDAHDLPRERLNGPHKHHAYSWTLVEHVGECGDGYSHCRAWHLHDRAGVGDRARVQQCEPSYHSRAANDPHVNAAGRPIRLRDKQRDAAVDEKDVFGSLPAVYKNLLTHETHVDQMWLQSGEIDRRERPGKSVPRASSCHVH